MQSNRDKSQQKNSLLQESQFKFVGETAKVTTKGSISSN